MYDVVGSQRLQQKDIVVPLVGKYLRWIIGPQMQLNWLFVVV